jgi:hypothetical protein
MPLEALASLKGWMARNNIEIKAKNLITGQNKKMIVAPEKVMAAAIKRNGIEASNFKQKSIDAVLPDFAIELQEIGTNSLILKITK